MTTVDARSSLVGDGIASRAWGYVRAHARKSVRAVVSAKDRVRRPVLTVGGFSCFSVAGFQVSSILGFVVTGLSLLTLEWLGGHE